MDKRQVQLHFILVGKCHKNRDNVLSFNALTAHQCMLSQIKDHFGNRAVYLPPRVERAANSIVYPLYYAAGWFVSNKLTNGNPGHSDLIVVAHGENMKDARQNLMKAVVETPWDDVALNM